MKNGLKEAAQENLQVLGKIIGDIRVGMLTTVSTTGEPYSRPMYVQQVDEKGDLWFFSSTKSIVVEQIRENSNVLITFADASKNKFLSAQATASEVFDRARMKELWTPFLKNWYKDGIDTPDIVLLKLEMQHVEYWDSPNSPVVKAVGLIKALTSDNEPYNPGRHEKVDMRH